MLDEIREYQRKVFEKYNFDYKRYFYDAIDFSDSMIGIVGARGVGKTTFLIQYLKELDIPFSKKLYISADTINIPSLFEVAELFSKEDGKVLVIDEIHKYNNFEIELKKIYDILGLKVIFSGSSALQIDNSKADLSRRTVIYHVYGLSFREFIEMNQGVTLPKYSLQEIFDNHVDIAFELLQKFTLRLEYREYVKQGYYPFYFENKKSYLLRLNETINTVIEVDIPSIFPIEYQNVINLKKLVRLVCSSLPYTPNMKKLLEKMQMGKNYKGLYRFLEYLYKAKVINIIKPKAKGDSIFVKPGKIFLGNTNLHFAYCENFEMGTIREALFCSMVTPNHSISIPKKGDFLLDNQYLIEIGGKNKNFKQIKDAENGYVVADDIEIGSGNKIPLWLFGFLY